MITRPRAQMCTRCTESAQQKAGPWMPRKTGSSFPREQGFQGQDATLPSLCKTHLLWGHASVPRGLLLVSGSAGTAGVSLIKGKQEKTAEGHWEAREWSESKSSRVDRPPSTRPGDVGHSPTGAAHPILVSGVAPKQEQRARSRAGGDTRTAHGVCGSTGRPGTHQEVPLQSASLQTCLSSLPVTLHPSPTHGRSSPTWCVCCHRVLRSPSHNSHGPVLPHGPHIRFLPALCHTSTP